MDDATNVVELPLFPLKTVLFPGQVLPLHIFEPRYQTMIRRCLADDSQFGVVLIRDGEEVGHVTAEPYQVGTFTRIVESTHLADGTMNILTVGTERFRIRHLLHDQPYLRGEVESFPIPVPVDTGRVGLLTERVRVRAMRYIELIAEAAGLKIEADDTPQTAQQVGYLAAVAMQIDNTEKQRLLDSETMEAMLAEEITLLNRENALLTWMAGSKEWPATVQFGPSGTLLPN